MYGRVAEEHEWEWQNFALWVHFVCGVLLAVAAAVGLWYTAMPVTTTMTTRHELPYVPARIEVVKDVTNVFSKQQALGGSGGVGLPQVERSNEAYQLHERDTIHFAVIRIGYSQTVVDYFDLTASAVFHTYVGPYEDPEHKKLGFTAGFYGATGGTIEGNVLTLNREFVIGEGMIVMSLAVAFGSVVLYITLLRIPVNHLLQSVKRWYMNRR